MTLGAQDVAATGASGKMRTCQEESDVSGVSGSWMLAVSGANWGTT